MARYLLEVPVNTEEVNFSKRYEVTGAIQCGEAELAEFGRASGWRGLWSRFEFWAGYPRAKDDITYS